MNEIEASSLHMNSLMYGFLIGLVLAVIIYIREIFKRRSLNKELKSLRKHLHQKLEIDAESMTGRQKEIEQLKKANENLRVTNKTLSQKPGRTEVLNYHIYQKAINYMAEAAPGFAPLWQKALKDAEEQVADMEVGTIPFIKRIIPIPFSGNKGVTEGND